MAARVPTFLQGASHPAADLRLDLGGLAAPASAAGALGVRGGVLPAVGALAVSAPGGLVARVAAGRCVVPGTEPTAGGLQGAYLCTNDANVDLAIAPTAAGQLRVDLIVARVYDAAYSGATNAFALEVVQGVPAAAAPAEPAVPVSAIVLARIDVPAAAGAIAAGNITDRRAYTTASGGVIPCTSTTRPANPYGGLVIFETDTKRLAYYDAALATWTYANPETAWRDITATVAAAAGFTFSGGYLKRRDLGNGVAMLAVTILRATGATTLTAAANGNFTDQTLITGMPADLVPSTAGMEWALAVASTGLAMVNLASTGSLVLTSGYPTESIQPGDIIRGVIVTAGGMQ